MKPEQYYKNITEVQYTKNQLKCKTEKMKYDSATDAIGIDWEGGIEKTETCSKYDDDGREIYCRVRVTGSRDRSSDGITEKWTVYAKDGKQHSLYVNGSFRKWSTYENGVEIYNRYNEKDEEWLIYNKGKNHIYSLNSKGHKKWPIYIDYETYNPYYTNVNTDLNEAGFLTMIRATTLGIKFYNKVSNQKSDGRVWYKKEKKETWMSYKPSGWRKLFSIKEAILTVLKVLSFLILIIPIIFAIYFAYIGDL